LIFGLEIRKSRKFYSPFCVQAKTIKLVGLKNGGRLSLINLVTFAGLQNGEFICNTHQYFMLKLTKLISEMSKKNILQTDLWRPSRTEIIGNKNIVY
jgi:hypothetical protein